MVLPCPQCGSNRSLSKLRKELRRVKERIMPSKHCVSFRSLGNGLVFDDSSALGGSLRSISEEDSVAIHNALVDTCADCGAFYAPNAKEVADELQSEIYKIDPLGALAAISTTSDTG